MWSKPRRLCSDQTSASQDGQKHLVPLQNASSQPHTGLWRLSMLRPEPAQNQAKNISSFTETLNTTIHYIQESWQVCWVRMGQKLWARATHFCSPDFGQVTTICTSVSSGVKIGKNRVVLRTKWLDSCGKPEIFSISLCCHCINCKHCNTRSHTHLPG